MKSHSEAIKVARLQEPDAESLVALYNELTVGPETARTSDIFSVMRHPGTAVFGARSAGRVIAMCTLHVLPNVTFDGRPYALIENVATMRAFRMRGIGRRVVQAAIDAAWAQNTYKIMLLTGQKRGARGFYEALGFSCEDKHGMVLRRA